jgi:hypothetical protein
VFPRDHTERSDLIDATMGEGSPFQRSFGYYAHGVDEATAILPQGWRDRLILVSGENTRSVRGWCLEVHDLAIAKYVAGREKDLELQTRSPGMAWSSASAGTAARVDPGRFSNPNPDIETNPSRFLWRSVMGC